MKDATNYLSESLASLVGICGAFYFPVCFKPLPIQRPQMDNYGKRYVWGAGRAPRNNRRLGPHFANEQLKSRKEDCFVQHHRAQFRSSQGQSIGVLISGPRLFLFISSTSNGSYSPKKTKVPTHQRKQKPILVCGSSRSAETCLFL